MKKIRTLLAMAGFFLAMLVIGQSSAEESSRVQQPWEINWTMAPSGAPAWAHPWPQTAASPEEKPVQWAPQGEQTCIKCHDEQRDRTVLFTAHGVRDDKRTPMAQHACESCHGPSSEHNNARPPKDEKRPPVDVVFKGEFLSPVDKRNQTCATCHAGGEHINWPGSQHQTNDVGCTDCHTNHVARDPVLSKTTEAQVCFGCHAEQRAESFLFSHHPVREGKVGCSDCHNTHGSGGQSLLKEFTVNEVCYTCHAEQRGPFLWEHEPVREDCSSCHKPHGSSQSALLTMRSPFLCQTCHQNSRAGHEGLVSGGKQLPGGGSPAQYNMLLARGCQNCHMKVHGSNAPSGGMLTR
jgi:DmsE family decaheme c-type cytochrome